MSCVKPPNLASLDPQIFGSKKFNDFGSHFVNAFHGIAFTKSLDLPNDLTYVKDQNCEFINVFTFTKCFWCTWLILANLVEFLPIPYTARWSKECESKLERSATVEIHFSKRDVMMATKEPKLSFAGGLGSIGE